MCSAYNLLVNIMIWMSNNNNNIFIVTHWLHYVVLNKPGQIIVLFSYPIKYSFLEHGAALYPSCMYVLNASVSAKPVVCMNMQKEYGQQT